MTEFELLVLRIAAGVSCGIATGLENPTEDTKLQEKSHLKKYTLSKNTKQDNRKMYIKFWYGKYQEEQTKNR